MSCAFGSGPLWPIGSIIMMEPGNAPPTGFVLIGTFHQIKEDDHDKDGKALKSELKRVNLYLKVQSPWPYNPRIVSRPDQRAGVPCC